MDSVREREVPHPKLITVRYARRGARLLSKRALAQTIDDPRAWETRGRVLAVVWDGAWPQALGIRRPWVVSELGLLQEKI